MEDIQGSIVVPENCHFRGAINPQRLRGYIKQLNRCSLRGNGNLNILSSTIRSKTPLALAWIEFLQLDIRTRPLKLAVMVINSRTPIKTAASCWQGRGFDSHNDKIQQIRTGCKRERIPIFRWDNPRRPLNRTEGIFKPIFRTLEGICKSLPGIVKHFALCKCWSSPCEADDHNRCDHSRQGYAIDCICGHPCLLVCPPIQSRSYIQTSGKDQCNQAEDSRIKSKLGDAIVIIGKDGYRNTQGHYRWPNRFAAENSPSTPRAHDPEKQSH